MADGRRGLEERRWAGVNRSRQEPSLLSQAIDEHEIRQWETRRAAESMRRKVAARRRMAFLVTLLIVVLAVAAVCRFLPAIQP
jgi:hypothetical protein